MDALILVARMALARLFAVAVFTKLVDRSGTEKSLLDFGISLPFAKPRATALSLAEFAAVLLLRFRRTSWGDRWRH